MISRASRSACLPWSRGQKNSPNCTIGSSSCRANSKAVTTPKLPPPPRTAQNRSGCSSAEARSTRPSAVTTSAETRLSMLSPYLRVSQPMPPPSVSPPTPVWLTSPAGTASPWARVAASRSASSAPPPARARRAAGSTVDRVQLAQVDHQAAVADGRARRVVRAAAHGHLQPVLARVADGRGHVGGRRAPRDHRGPPVDPGVPHPPPVVEPGIAGRDDGSFHHRAKVPDPLGSRLRHDILLCSREMPPLTRRVPLSGFIACSCLLSTSRAATLRADTRQAPYRRCHHAVTLPTARPPDPAARRDWAALVPVRRAGAWTR